VLSVFAWGNILLSVYWLLILSLNWLSFLSDLNPFCSDLISRSVPNGLSENSTSLFMNSSWFGLLFSCFLLLLRPIYRSRRSSKLLKLVSTQVCYYRIGHGLSQFLARFSFYFLIISFCQFSMSVNYYYYYRFSRFS